MELSKSKDIEACVFCPAIQLPVQACMKLIEKEKQAKETEANHIYKTNAQNSLVNVCL